MYTLLVGVNNEIITTVKERIIQRSKLVDNLHFLVEPDYKGTSMDEFVVLLEYISPVSREYHTEILVKSNNLYKSHIEYTLPFDTKLTKEAGEIEIQLTFIKVEMDDKGNTVQKVRKTSPATITIIPVAAWSNVVADSSLTAIDQRLIMAEAMINAANDTLSILDATKADNIVYDKITNILQLTANGQPIGDSIEIVGIDTGISSIEIDEFGNIIVSYLDGRVENIGTVSHGSCAGVYIPNYTADGMLTFTLKTEPEKHEYEFDIKDSNNWNPIDSPEQSSDYIWKAL